jgi:biotin transport system ATP-binding protein
VIELDDAGVRVTGSAGQSRVLLQPTSLTLTERRVAVIGANGSGKSTLARLINGLRPATTGHVRTLGLDVATHGAQVRARVGFVFTDPDAQLVMPTAVEDVALSLRRSIPDAGERDEVARGWLDRLGLGEHASTPVHALSGGQKQLLALAGVLATEPEVLVCDEPTTLLDLRWRHVVDGLLDSVDAQVLLVTHDLEAARRADRVLVIDGGRVILDEAGDYAVESYRTLMTAP